MKKIKFLLIITLAVLSQAAYSASDEFKDVTCEADIPKAVIGKHSANERVVVIEARHKNIGLKDEGADDVSENDSDRLFTIYWKICGKRFVVLDSNGLIRDVIQLPLKTDATDEYTGKCKLDGKEIHEFILAIKENTVIKTAWKIDGKKGFVKIPSQGLQCR
jgi:hypothetical protein